MGAENQFMNQVRRNISECCGDRLRWDLGTSIRDHCIHIVRMDWLVGFRTKEEPSLKDVVLPCQFLKINPFLNSDQSEITIIPMIMLTM